VAPETLGQARPRSAGDGEQDASVRQGDGAQEPGASAATRSDAPQQGGAVAAAQGASRQDGVAEVVSPALQSIDGAVIIRRGDTLWHISRRVYGHGIRYTTIYLANQEQIRNPDRIWPGQIFTVPDRTEQGEHADLGAIGDQALTPEEAAARETAQ
jgi:nucleoid-associated protein YgaU